MHNAAIEVTTDHFINSTRTRAPLRVTFEVITTVGFSSGIHDTLMNA
jgi:hypothetical protein